MTKMTKVVLIEWWDAGTGSTVEEAASHRRTAVGFEVQTNEQGVWLALDGDWETSPADIHFIPRGMILAALELVPLPSYSARPVKRLSSGFVGLDTAEGAD